MASLPEDTPDGRVVALVVLVLLLGISLLFFALLGDYGPGYDELIGDFQYGERTFYFLRTWDHRYLDLLKPLGSQPSLPPIEVAGHRDLLTPELEAPFVHGHGAALGSAVTCWLFFRTLGILPAVDAHHAVNWLFATALVVVLFSQMHRLFGLLTALLVVVLWLAQPRLFAHWFFNIKDFPEACLFGMSVLVFWSGWYPRRRRGLLVVAAALWGFALSVKINAIFLPVILALWVSFSRPRPESSGETGKPLWPAIRSEVPLVVGLALVSALAFFLSWPYLWLHPQEFLRHVEFVVSRGHSGEWGFGLGPLWDWLTATPELVLLGTGFGIVLALRERQRDRRSFLVLTMLWLAVPLVRANLPGMRHYDGIRHFLEITVPTAVLAGYGWMRLIDGLGELARRWLKAAGPAHAVRTASVLLLLSVAAWPFAGLHPYQLAYFNDASGGLRAARERGHPDAGDYWAASYRQGIRWLNGNLPHGSVLTVPFAEHLVNLTRGSRDGLRFDVRLLHVTGPFAMEAGEVFARPYKDALEDGPVYVMFVTRSSWENSIMVHAERYGTQLFPHGDLGGAPVLSIYKVPQLPPTSE